jgi:hypothetical protein
MHNRPFPAFARIRAGEPDVEAHSRGGTGAGGHYAFGLGGGARLVWQAVIAPMCTADALEFRAFLHSLRGPSGSVAMVMPTRLATTVGALADYTDGTDHTDGTVYDDNVTNAPGLVIGSVTAAAPAGTKSVGTNAGFAPSLTVGEFIAIATVAGLQVVRVTAVSALFVAFRPRLRAATVAGAVVHGGPVTGRFRLVGNPPVVPLQNLRSGELTLDLEEVY